LEGARAEGVGLGVGGGATEDLVEVGQRSKKRVHVGVVGNVVAEVGHRRAVEGGYPHGVHTERRNVVGFQSDSLEITNSIAIGIAKGSRIHLKEVL
jgi:hypothetical protein